MIHPKTPNPVLQTCLIKQHPKVKEMIDEWNKANTRRLSKTERYIEIMYLVNEILDEIIPKQHRKEMFMDKIHVCCSAQRERVWLKKNILSVPADAEDVKAVVCIITNNVIKDINIYATTNKHTMLSVKRTLKK